MTITELEGLRRNLTGLFISMLSWEIKVGDYRVRYCILKYVSELYVVHRSTPY